MIKKIITILLNLILLPLNLMIIIFSIAYQTSIRLLILANTFIGILFFPLKQRIKYMKPLNEKLGEVYQIPAKFIIPKKKWKNYSQVHNLNDSRNIVIVGVKWWGGLIIANITSANQKSFTKYYTDISKSKDMKKNSKIDPRVIKRNTINRLRFRVWHFPFYHKPKSKISKTKLNEYNKKQKEYKKIQKK